MESEFFGHVKGSFTGAIRDKQGLFEAADGGTLFLDEIAELPLQMQVKLLRAIQERAVKTVGSSTEKKIDVRIISATHRNLQQEVDAGGFRLDLYYRLNVIGLQIPPLRERGRDILELAAYLLAGLSRQTLPAGKEFSLTPAAREKLLSYDFPGNVRELENVLERAVAFAETATIDDGLVDIEQRTLKTRSLNDGLAGGGSSEGSDEKLRLQQVLELNRWNRTEAARQLGLTLRQIRYRIAKYGLDRNEG
jgi:two-component system response regulator PilR (NtrC family)